MTIYVGIINPLKKTHWVVVIVSAKMVSPRKIICINDQIGIVVDANRVI